MDLELLSEHASEVQTNALHIPVNYPWDVILIAVNHDAFAHAFGGE
jgi:hypothetical protein